ncbi:MAG TPA: heme-binding protein [Stellaceae bacterium]|nr:heme-binding protein [Stellaceae bacterium]
MKNPALTLLAGVAFSAIATVAVAQQAAVPEKMPFDIPYGTPISLEHAMKVAHAAEAEAKKHDWKMNIAVVGPAGELRYFLRMDDAQIASVQIAQDKAHSAATFRRPTKAFFEAVEKGHVYISFLAGVVPSEGGIPLVEGGKLIGAIGCSGGTGAQDGVTCQAGADTVK